MTVRLKKICHVSSLNLSFQCMSIDAPLHLLSVFRLFVEDCCYIPLSPLWAEQAQLLLQVNPFCTGVSLSWMHKCSDGKFFSFCLGFFLTQSTLDACVPILWQGSDTWLECSLSPQVRSKSSYLETSSKFPIAAFFLKTHVLSFKNAEDKTIMCQCWRVPKAILWTNTESNKILRVR